MEIFVFRYRLHVINDSISIWFILRIFLSKFFHLQFKIQVNKSFDLRDACQSCDFSFLSYFSSLNSVYLLHLNIYFLRKGKHFCCCLILNSNPPHEFYVFVRCQIVLGVKQFHDGKKNEQQNIEDFDDQV
jgi:hypothetical protein